MGIPRVILTLCLVLLPAIQFPAFAALQTVVKDKWGITIQNKNGTLQLIPLDERSIRVRFTRPESRQQEELVYVQGGEKPRFRVSENSRHIVLKLPSVSAEYRKDNQTLTFIDKLGNVLLREKAGGRLLQESPIQGETAFVASQSFCSPREERLFGIGQFQDGYVDVRDLPRRLTQVNTQIAIPFLLSSRGYALLWNNYGMTDFNPADQKLTLTRAEHFAGETVTVNATSTGGNRTEQRKMNQFYATLTVPQDGTYSFLLDTGQKMGRKHYIAIDGTVVVNLNNIWLPPTTSFRWKLKKGNHRIEVRGDDNDKPILYWRESRDETVFRSPVAQCIDYTVFAGIADEAIASYRSLTGGTPLPPLWALGYIHCRERYNTQQELLDNAAEFRRRHIPIDMIVQDWQYWGRYGWNAMQFDERNYPDPAEMVKQLHAMDMKLMLSVWAKVDRNSELGKEIARHGYYIKDTDWVDFFNPDAAQFYWKNFSNRLLKPFGIDAWWQDATEPENDDLAGRRVNKGKSLGDAYRNAFPMLVNKTVYSGLRADNGAHRAMILTRSGFQGMQRYGATTWSGDVGHDWETLRRQIAGGLGMMASGLPWWTYDAGGFFRPANQYTDKGYHECFVRWLQAAAFLPMMRVHGYMSHTEPWRYGPEVERLSKKYICLRYSLLPYIYSHAAAVTRDGYTLMRPLVMDFPQDSIALDLKDEYMFGKSFLVAPVLQAGVKYRSVYLPMAQAGWTDFWSGTTHAGGTTVQVEAGLDRIPLYVRRGSIVPLCFGMESTKDMNQRPVEVRIYPGADGDFVWYEDNGDNYDYENGQFSTFTLHWDDSRRTLTVSRRNGTYQGMKADKTLRIVVVNSANGTGDTPATTAKEITYTGKKMNIKL